MTGDDEFIGQLEDYLESFDGVTPLPEHVRHEVNALLPGTRQARPRPGPLRGLTMISRMSAPLRWGVAALTLVVAAGLGAALLTANRSQGVATVAPTPSPTPVATPVVTPVTLAALLTLRNAPAAPCAASDTGNGCIKAGTYVLSPDVSTSDVSFQVPSGWFEWDIGLGSEGVLVQGGSDAPDGSGWGLMFITPGSVSRDPCDTKAGTYPPADVDTVDELVAAMSKWPGFKATTPQPTSIGGVAGQMVQLTSTKTVATCPAAGLWQTPQFNTLDGYALVDQRPEQHAVQFRVLDLEGKLLVIRTTDFPEVSPFEVQQGVKADPKRHVSDQAALHAMLDSIQIGQTTAP
jgi:hypothetical protein